MSRDELITLRKSLGLNQTEMGEAIGLKLRAYAALETGEAEVRKLHWLAAERVALAHAAKSGDLMAAPPSVRRDALEVARVITGEERATLSKAAHILADTFATTVERKLSQGYRDLYVWEQGALDWLREWRKLDPDEPINLWTSSYLKYGPPPWRTDQT